jgi:stalled ribosome rescue protein Dom34
MKKIRSPEIKGGIWIDQEKAYIIQIEGIGPPVLEIIKSNVESRIRIPGEEKVSARFGQSFIDDQEKKQRRQHQQREKYFKHVVKLVKEWDYLYLMGPGPAKNGLQNVLENDTTAKVKIILTETADQMTRQQLIAKVETFFKNKLFLLLKRKLKKEMLATRMA